MNIIETDIYAAIMAKCIRKLNHAHIPKTQLHMHTVTHTHTYIYIVYRYIICIHISALVSICLYVNISYIQTMLLYTYICACHNYTWTYMYMCLISQFSGVELLGSLKTHGSIFSNVDKWHCQFPCMNIPFLQHDWYVLCKLDPSATFVIYSGWKLSSQWCHKYIGVCLFNRLWRLVFRQSVDICWWSNI